MLRDLKPEVEGAVIIEAVDRNCLIEPRMDGVHKVSDGGELVGFIDLGNAVLVMGPTRGDGQMLAVPEFDRVGVTSVDKDSTMGHCGGTRRCLWLVRLGDLVLTSWDNDRLLGGFLKWRTTDDRLRRKCDKVKMAVLEDGPDTSDLSFVRGAGRAP